MNFLSLILADHSDPGDGLTKAVLFWIIFIVWCIFTAVVGWPVDRKSGPSFVLLILLALLGWKVFGPAVQ